jgi:hypothetical protein
LTEIKVLATGEYAVIKFLEAEGVPDFGIPSLLESSECNPGRWPWGAQVSTSVETKNPEAVMVTVTLRGWCLPNRVRPSRRLLRACGWRLHRRLNGQAEHGML